MTPAGGAVPTWRRLHAAIAPHLHGRRRAFALVEERTLAWTRADAATAPRLLALADPATEAAAAIHAGQHAGASPHELIESFAVLIAPAGVFAAIGPA